MKTNKGFISAGLIIILVLVIAGVGYLILQQKNNPTTLGENEPKVKENFPKETELVCGIFVEKPASGEELIIGNNFQVKGYVNGCNWTAFEAEAAVISIEDANGNIVMEKKPIPVSGEWMQLPAYFDSIFIPNLPATTGTGFVIFENEDASGENPQTFKVPVVFGTD